MLRTKRRCTRCHSWRWRPPPRRNRPARQDERVSPTDLLPLLEERLHGLYSPLLADTTASIMFTAGGMANWTIDIDRGRTAARRGGPADPTTTVRARLDVLDDV